MMLLTGLLVRSYWTSPIFVSQDFPILERRAGDKESNPKWWDTDKNAFQFDLPNGAYPFEPGLMNNRSKCIDDSKAIDQAGELDAHFVLGE